MANRMRLPKYLQAETAILQSIQDGRYPPGSRLPSDRDLAATLGIAPMTLRQAMTRLLDQGVLERRQRVGTYVRECSGAPNAAILFFYMRRIHSGTLPERALELIGRALGNGRQLRPILLVEPLPSPAQIVSELRTMRVGAVGLMNFLNRDRDFVRTLSQMIPCVLFNKGLSGVNLPASAPDSAAIARLAVNWLADRGRTRIGMGHFCSEHQAHQDLCFAVQNEIAARGLAVDRRFCHETDSFGPNENTSFEWLDAILDADPRPDGLIANTTAVADHVVRRLAAQGRRLGEDLDVVALHSGANAHEMGRSFPIIGYNDEGAVTAAAQMLMDIFDGRMTTGSAPLVRVPAELVLPHTGVIREPAREVAATV